MKGLLYISPYIYTNVVYPFPILILNFKTWKRQTLSTAVNTSYCIDNYLHTIKGMQFEMELISNKEGETYGLELCIQKLKEKIYTLYDIEYEINNRRSIEFKMGNLIYQYFRDFHLRSYNKFFPNLELLQNRGVLTKSHKKIIKDLSYLPSFYRRRFLLSKIKKPKWETEYEKLII